jgi:dihydrofolate reductase
MRTILYLAMSLNGKIARSDGSVDWLEQVPNPEGTDYGYEEFFRSIDITVQGNGTYRQLRSWGIPFPYAGKENYVLTRDVKEVDNDDVRFVRQDPVRFLERLKAREGNGIWIVGGAQINALLLAHGLIDEIRLFVMPLVLAEGLDLSAELPRDVALRLVETRAWANGVVELRYTIGEVSAP